jgi:hypothetical protein
MKKQILPAVITLCFVKAIGNARVTHIFPFIASCENLSSSEYQEADFVQTSYPSE